MLDHEAPQYGCTDLRGTRKYEDTKIIDFKIKE